MEGKGSKKPTRLTSVLLGIGFLSVVLWNIEIGYQARSAGPVSDASDIIVTEGVETYPPKGELLMLTVIGQDVNVFEAVIAVFDPTIDLVEKSAFRRPGETDEQYRNRVLEQMDDSNFRSVAVALEYLGYEMVPTEVVVNEVLDGVPAEGVIERGDTILSLNGSEISSVEQLRNALEGLEPGEVVSMTVDRQGSIVDLEVELIEHTERPGDPMIGVTIGELTEPPFPVSIEAGDIGGPSAGLMHTLAIIDTLTEGELTAGRVIAGTGTIAIDGTVGIIGSIRQKVVGAEAAGAEFILVPAAQYELALTAEFETIEIVPVSTLDEAIEFLESLSHA